MLIKNRREGKVIAVNQIRKLSRTMSDKGRSKDVQNEALNIDRFGRTK
jgi:hypothetical protein